MKVSLSLWVSNQVGSDSDCTSEYIESSGWVAPSGIILDDTKITGEADEVWASYRSLAQAVRSVGHGSDMDGNDVESDSPILTACPEELMCQGYTCAAESVARLESPLHETWDRFLAAIS